MANGAARIAMWAPLWLLASVAPAHDLAAGGDKACPVSVTAWFTAPGLAHRADLYVVADVDPDFHIYSITQPEGGPNRSRIQLDPSCAYRVVRDFVAVTPPQRTRDWDVFAGLPMEEHRRRIVWHAVVELPRGMQPGPATIQGSLWAQVDNDVKKYCIPPEAYRFTASCTGRPRLREALLRERRPLAGLLCCEGCLPRRFGT